MRIVIGASAKFPEIGRAFYEAGPAQGVAKLSNYLRLMTEKGLLEISNFDRAARHFMDLCKSGIHLKMMLGYASEPPTQAELEENVESAVAVFLKAYGAPGLHRQT